jgi:hypothetical protein
MRLMTFFAAGCLSRVDLTMAVAQDAMVHCLPIVLASSRSFKALSDSARGAFEPVGEGGIRIHVTVTRTTVFEFFVGTLARLGNDLPIISFVLGEPHHGLRSLNGGNNGQNIGIFLVPAKNEGRGRRIGAKAVLPGLVHPTWPDHSWGSLGQDPKPLSIERGCQTLSSNYLGKLNSRSLAPQWTFPTNFLIWAWVTATVPESSSE